MATLSEIEKAVKDFSDARKILRDRAENLTEGVRALKKRYIPGIQSAVATAKEKQAILSAAIEESRDLFVRPRTMTLFGVKFGVQKGKGKLEWGKGAAPGIVKLIKKLYEDAWETYVKIKETPNKDTLSTLSSAELKKLGIQVTDTGDAVLIKPTDDEVDKLVDALLEEKAETEEQEEAA